MDHISKKAEGKVFPLYAVRAHAVVEVRVDPIGQLNSFLTMEHHRGKLSLALNKQTHDKPEASCYNDWDICKEII